jgi:hypothetical protein
LIEGAMAPSLDRSCRSLEGQFDLRVVIPPKLLYSQTTAKKEKDQFQFFKKINNNTNNNQIN